MQKLGIILLAFYIANINGVSQIFRKPNFSWICVDGRCEKQTNSTNNGVNLNACKTICGEFGNLWPQPTIKTNLGKKVVNFDIGNIHVIQRISRKNVALRTLMNSATKIFKSYLRKMHPMYENYGNHHGSSFQGYGGKLIIRVDVSTIKDETVLKLDTDESYKILISKDNGQLDVLIAAETFYGVRHGLETLSQLITYNEDEDCLQIIESAEIEDKPIYPYRGILVDTVRNFIPIDIIKKIIDAMSYNKLNTFHWHLTDSQSFPFYSKSLPQMTAWGAYSKYKIYYPQNISDIVHYANIRGVKVVPEFDSPSHVGMGWQWADGMEKLALCLEQEPWDSYCLSPPCGQLNVVNERVYDILGMLYKDFSDAFETDLFHMGGDEVSINCWNTSHEILNFINKTFNGSREEETFFKLWKMFHEKAYDRLKIAYGDRAISAIIWSSKLTAQPDVEDYLDKDKYIIQFWAYDDKAQIKQLYDKKYKLILSNSDAWYLDCGYHNWIGYNNQLTNNWCSPYKTWQQVYENSPSKLILSPEKDNDLKMKRNLKRDPQILGGEACMWSEQVSKGAIEGKIWPRGAAVAERLWAEPNTNWSVAEPRMLHNSHRMLQRGINVDALQPEWCLQNICRNPKPPNLTVEPAVETNTADAVIANSKENPEICNTSWYYIVLSLYTLFIFLKR